MSSKTNSGTYRFILTPLDRVFFGGEKTPFEQNEYYLHSGYFPQQTGLLGLLRYFILQKSGLLGGPQSSWAGYIGPESFSGQPRQQFGLVEGLSPLSIYSPEGKDLYFQRSVRGLKAAEAPAGVQVSFGEEAGARQDLSYFSGYNPKSEEHLNEYLSGLQGDELPVFTKEEEDPATGLKRPKPGSGVFTKDVKPGITKNYAGETKEEGYFKLVYYRMARGYAYSFKARLQDSPDGIAWEGTSFIRMGGDASHYRLEVRRDGGWENGAGSGSTFYLLSDAAVDNTIYGYCRLWAAGAISFRNLKTSTGDKSFDKRPSWDGVRHGATYEGRRLLQRGSILVASPGQEEALAGALKNEVFEKIGYNHFIRTENLL